MPSFYICKKNKCYDINEDEDDDDHDVDDKNRVSVKRKKKGGTKTCN